MEDKDCRVISLETRVGQHGCDTQRGSSGGPILLPSGGIVGIHLDGSPKLNEKGEEILKKGLVEGFFNSFMPVRTIAEYLAMKEAHSIIKELSFVNW